MSDTFDAFIMGVIILNVGCLAVTHVNMPMWLVAALFWLNVVFTTTFVVEAAVKIIALGFKGYFTDRCCTFDFAVAALSVVQIAIDVWTVSDIPAINLLRVFRVTRIFRLIPKVRVCTIWDSHVKCSGQMLPTCRVHCVWLCTCTDRSRAALHSERPAASMPGLCRQRGCGRCYRLLCSRCQLL
jgi:Ion transport protein